MSENPYAPPTSDLETAVSSDETGEFYVVSKKKFYSLFIATMGLYTVYWFYKNWSLYRDASGEKIWPIPRAIFSIFFVHSLFRKVQEKMERSGVTYDWNSNSLAGIVVALIIISNVLDNTSAKSIGSPYTDWLSVIILVPLVFTMHKAQLAINVSCDDAEGKSNDAFTWANYVWLTLGCMLWILAMIGLFVPA